MSHIPQNEVWFYEGIFSNFYNCKIIIAGQIYSNSEAYYQSQKFKGETATNRSLEYANIISIQTAGKAAILARQKKPYQNYDWAKKLWNIMQKYDVELREDWDLVKNNVMRRAVFQKFHQNSKLKLKLIDTENKLLFEHTSRDNYWADGHPKNNPNIHGNGKNMLGIILEETRYLLGGDIAERPKNKLIFDYSNWIIPGLLLLSGAPRKKQYTEFKNFGFKYIVSLIPLHQEKTLGIAYLPKKYSNVTLKEDDFCLIDDGVLVSRWAIEDRKITTDEKAMDIVHTIIRAIEHNMPVVVHCFGGKGRSGTIVCLVLGIIYGLSGEEAIKMTNLLFKHRPNKGKVRVGIPQSKIQKDQVIRLLKPKMENRNYNNFSWEPTHLSM